MLKKLLKLIQTQKENFGNMSNAVKWYEEKKSDRYHCEDILIILKKKNTKKIIIYIFIFYLIFTYFMYFIYINKISIILTIKGFGILIIISLIYFMLLNLINLKIKQIQILISSLIIIIIISFLFLNKKLNTAGENIILLEISEIITIKRDFSSEYLKNIIEKECKLYNKQLYDVEILNLRRNTKDPQRIRIDIEKIMQQKQEDIEDKQQKRIYMYGAIFALFLASIVLYYATREGEYLYDSFGEQCCYIGPRKQVSPEVMQESLDSFNRYRLENGLIGNRNRVN